MIDKTILHYKIIAKLGEGGMGVVYKAEDTKLERVVAIKFLPHHIAANAEERERFKIEAKAAAALNHPNSATIYAIEEVDDQMFIVMEYIDGKELREIIKSEIPNPQSAIEYATQIAEGLKAAHAKGVTHRGIKSSNIMVTESGQVKIMDFGLAKIAGGAQLTKDHSTLGTAAYMSPEQARGEPVDHRTDIWAFGVVLYEMLTGQLPFRGEYEQARLANTATVNPEAHEAYLKGQFHLMKYTKAGFGLIGKRGKLASCSP
ncbi:serine/threonine protein kinase [candidate division KSB1 bacterium]|nr:serine/threonine protein kinase [candidate division KSB1 bacterium]